MLLSYLFLAPTSPPLNVTAHNTSSTSIFVTWSPPPSDNIPGILLGYEVSYTPSEPEISHNSSTIRRVMLCSCNTSIELTNLTVYEPYNITVAAFTSAGIGNESEIRQIWTDEEGLFFSCERNETLRFEYEREYAI